MVVDFQTNDCQTAAAEAIRNQRSVELHTPQRPYHTVAHLAYEADVDASSGAYLWPYCPALHTSAL